MGESTSTSTSTVNIRPGVSILSVLPHLNYRPWFALAEFVDNSLQSYLTHRSEIEEIEGNDVKLKVSVELNSTDGGRITIRDNAAGIHESDYARAFRPAELPLDRSGLNEFGMGMKSAACWFATHWAVRTSAIGEPLERKVVFDIDRIIRDDIEELSIGIQPVKPETHYTEITLSKLVKPPKGRTVAKIREHLASIYRVFIRRGLLELSFDGDVLTFQQPKILVAPYYKGETSEIQTWRKDINFDFGQGLLARGFVAIREVGSTSHAGLALFRRDRLIQGSADETYRPETIFGRPNSFTFQRVFGELHLEGFDVSHTKDGFQWDDNEDIFLDLLREELDRAPMALLDQAEGYRARQQQRELRIGAETAADRTADVIEREVPRALQDQLGQPQDAADPPPVFAPAVTVLHREIDVEFDERKWQIVLEMSNDPAIGDWIEICDQLISPKSALDANSSVRQVGIRLALAHPFMERFGGVEASRIEPLLRVAVALVLSEIIARSSGVKMAGAIRRNVNELLRGALSKP